MDIAKTKEQADMTGIDENVVQVPSGGSNEENNTKTVEEKNAEEEEVVKSDEINEDKSDNSDDDLHVDDSEVRTSKSERNLTKATNLDDYELYTAYCLLKNPKNCLKLTEKQ
ncbi:hypothetical protein QE152_g7436 [Popillia japonica]|uniref:Uncharacterized protein n=1 Tax=Popillia japonica TaxID=7064 RepID=A0AAW1MGJ4_POPJA